MKNLENQMKAPMHKSYCKPSSLNKDQISNSLVNSFIDMDSSAKNVKYKYERVNNMFKLVAVDENNENRECSIEQGDGRIVKMESAIQKLSQRMAKIQLAVPELNTRFDDILTDLDSLNFRVDFSDEKAKKVLQEVDKLKQKLESIELHTLKYDQTYQVVQMNFTASEQKYDKMIKDFSVELSDAMDKLQEKLSEQIIMNNQKRKDSELSTSESSANINVSPIGFSLHHIQCYKHEGTTYKVSQILYKVDSEGRLLDEDGFMVLDSQNKQIRLNGQHIQKLKSFGLFRSQ